MEDLSNGMQNLVDDIISSAKIRNAETESRHVKLSEMKSDTFNLMQRIHLERKDMSKNLNKKFSAEKAVRLANNRQFVDDTDVFMKDIKKELDAEFAFDRAKRHESAQLLINSVRNFMEGIRSDIGKMSKSLRNKFDSDRKVRLEVHKQFVDSVRSKLQEMAKVLDEILALDKANREKAIQQFRLDVSAFLKNVRKELQETATELEKKLTSDKTARKEAVSDLMSDIKTFMQNVKSELHEMAKMLDNKLSSDEASRKAIVKEFMDEIISDRSEAQNIWMKFSKDLVEETVVEVPSEPVGAVSPEPVPADDLSTEERVKAVIAKYPEGVKLVDIGNELGVDWRGLIGVVKTLVDDYKIDKIDSLYYPKS